MQTPHLPRPRSNRSRMTARMERRLLNQPRHFMPTWGEQVLALPPEERDKIIAECQAYFRLCLPLARWFMAEPSKLYVSPAGETLQSIEDLPALVADAVRINLSDWFDLALDPWLEGVTVVANRLRRTLKVIVEKHPLEATIQIRDVAELTAGDIRTALRGAVERIKADAA